MLFGLRIVELGAFLAARTGLSKLGEAFGRRAYIGLIYGYCFWVSVFIGFRNSLRLWLHGQLAWGTMVKIIS